jgi:DNA repair exonuclease SbcCD nuclease subunit
MLKLLHTSDIQLDAPFGFLGTRGRDHRRLLREAFGRIIALAESDGFDVILIAGDLFDSNTPHQTTVEFVATQIAHLGIPVCILPGNHDCYDDRSIYRKASFPDNALVLTEQPAALELPDLDLTVYGNPVRSSQSRISALQGLQPTGRTRWHVALAHGNLLRPDIIDPSRPIDPEDIATSGMDYVAMGDWHAFADYSQGDVKAFYSGAPEPTALGQRGAGYVACVELDENHVRVSPKRVGTVTTDEMTLNVEGRNGAEVVEAIMQHADPQLMLRVTLTGLKRLGTVIDVSTLESELSSAFYHIDCVDESHPHLETIADDDYPEEMVIGKFVRLMQDRIEQAADADVRRRAEQAIQVGVALLEGKEVI